MSTILSVTTADITTADDGSGTFIADVTLPGTDADLLLVGLTGYNTGPDSITIDGLPLTFDKNITAPAIHGWYRAAVTAPTTLQIKTNPIISSVTNQVSANSGDQISVTFASSTSDQMLIDIASLSNIYTITALAGQTVDVDNLNGFRNTYASHKGAVGANETIGWTATATDTVSQIAYLLNSVSASDTTPPTTLYLSSEATPPTDAEVVAGNYANAISNASVAVSATGTITFPQFIGLTGNTAYTVKIVHEDAAGNQSTGVTASATTQSATISVTLAGGASLTGLDYVVFDSADLATASIMRRPPG